MAKERLSLKELDWLRRLIKSEKISNNNKPVSQHYGPREDSEDTFNGKGAAETNARFEGYNNKPVSQHYGSREDSEDTYNGKGAAEITARIKGYNNKPVSQHYGPSENLNKTDTEIFEAQVAENRKKESIQLSYFKGLLDNPEILNLEEFKDYVSKSTEPCTLKTYKFNGIDRETFVEAIFNQVQQKVLQLSSIDKVDQTKINQSKSDIEKLITIYVKYMYELKENQFNFSNLETMKMSDWLDNKLSQEQKRLDIVFEMPIPIDLEKEYGKKLNQVGKMIPGLKFMYQHLMGKKVNWHQIIINEEKAQNITPAETVTNALKSGTTSDMGHLAESIEPDLDPQKNNDSLSKD